MDVELSSHPVFSFLVYDNGEVRLVYLRQNDPSIDSIFSAGDDKRRLAQLKYETNIQRSRFDSTKFAILKSIALANSSLLEKSAKGEEDGARFIMDFYGQEKTPVSCSWQEPLSKKRAAFVKVFLDLAFREFPNDTAQILREAVFDNTPSLNHIN